MLVLVRGNILKSHVAQLDADVKCEQLPHLQRVITCQHSRNTAVDFLSSLHGLKKSLQRAHALASDVAVIWTTSGSTGYSKLVPQTHANLLHIMLQVLHISQLGGGEKLLNCAPLGWAGGFPLWFLASGATRVFLDTTRGLPRDMATMQWQCIQQEKCVYMFTTPMFVSRILEQPELWQGDEKWRPRGICLAGQPMKQKVVFAAGRLCDFVDINYGTTECGVITTTRVADPQAYQDGATGPAALGVKLRLVDSQLQDVSDGETGEILAQSPALYGLYVDNELATQQAFTKDGWFRSDDVGYFLPNGNLVHLGRRTDAIMRGAYICYPGWLEAILRQAYGVQDVCVVPVHDPVLHHEICACIVPEDDPPTPDFEASLREFADSQLLTKPGDAQHMVPKYYVMLQSFPLTVTGKNQSSRFVFFCWKTTWIELEVRLLLLLLWSQEACDFYKSIIFIQNEWLHVFFHIHMSQWRRVMEAVKYPLKSRCVPCSFCWSSQGKYVAVGKMCGFGFT